MDEWISQGVKPDITFLIDLDPVIGLKRSKHRLQTKGMMDQEGRFEMEELAFHQRVRQTFLDRAKQEPSRIHMIDGSQSIEEIFEKVKEVLENKLSVIPATGEVL